MADFDDRIVRGATTVADTMDTGLRAHMLRVYNYMVGALALTGAVAWLVANTPALYNSLFHEVMTANGYTQSPTLLGWVVMLAPLAMVFFLSYRIMQMSQQAAQATFWVYAAMVGASLAYILKLYTGASVAMTFFVTAATFGAMSLWGYTTQRDLTGIGSFMLMGLVGLVVAMLVNIFLKSSGLDWAISVIGVLIFVGLTAYDTQRIKEMYSVQDDGTIAGRKAVMGALSLYLDFINLFLMLLRLLGDRR